MYTYTIVILPFIVCESRTFGNNCSENCYCVSQRQCNKATGVCPVGECERGYKGIKKLINMLKFKYVTYVRNI